MEKTVETCVPVFMERVTI